MSNYPDSVQRKCVHTGVTESLNVTNAKKSNKIYQVSGVTCHVSCVPCHMSLMPTATATDSSPAVRSEKRWDVLKM